MKRLLFILIFVSSVIITNAQNLKTFNGETAGEIGLGNVTYTYLLDSEGNKVNHGTYKFIETHKSADRGSFSSTLSGTFKNGLKHGTWTYTKTLNDALSSGNIYITSTTNVIMKYNDGVPDGNWSYSYSGKYRTRLYSSSGWRWGNYELQKPDNIQISWKNGTIVGNLVFNTSYAKAIGQLDMNGIWIGKWIIDGVQWELDGGIVKTGLTHDMLGYPIKDDNEIIVLREKYKSLPIDERVEFVNKHRLKIDTVSGIKYYNINDGYFNNRIFNCDAPEGSYVSKEKLDYGKFTIITKAKIISLKDLLSQHSINFNFQTPESLEKLLEKNKANLSDSDIEVFKDQIEKLKIKRNGESEEAEYQKLYEESYSQLLVLTKITNKICQKPINRYDYYIKDIDILLDKFRIDWDVKYFTTEKYKVSDFSIYGYKSHAGNTLNSIYKSDVGYKNSYNEISEYIRNIQSKEHGVDFVTNLYCLYEKTRQNIYKVDYGYVTNMKEIKTNGTWSIQYPKTTKKSQLYKPYFTTIQYISNGISKNMTFEETYESINYINDICTYMIDNLNTKTKDIEKELSSTDNVEDWVEIFRKHIKK